MLVLLQPSNPACSKAMRQVIAHGSVPNDEIYYRLHGAGLARRQSGASIRRTTLCPLLQSGWRE